MGVGAAQALTLSSVLIQSCTRHALANYAPSQAMKQQWPVEWQGLEDTRITGFPSGQGDTS
eukprot:366552-Amphidinium_carterae.1